MANSRLCSIDTCDKPHYSMGYCLAHYRRLKRHGDPLGGSTSKGELMRFIHEVALLHIGDECLRWPFGKSANGYGSLKVGGKDVRASRYICELSHGEPPTPQHEAAHSCGNGHEGCIAPGHLSWKTHTENMADSIIHGTSARGERHGLSKLTEADAREIISLKGVETQISLAARFGVSQKAISNIHTGTSWAWLLAL